MNGAGLIHQVPPPRYLQWRRSLLLWIGVLLAVAVWTRVAEYGWDVAIYRSALHAVRLGHDPYAAATAIQVQTHLAGGVPKGTDPPYSYVYPPATLPLLHAVARLRPGLAQSAYWLVYASAVLGQIWFVMQFVQPNERRWMLICAPLAPFFPGLLANGILMSGNIAYMLYAAVLLSALRGWRGRGWTLFFMAVLFASFFKAPLLTLAFLAPLSARKQWTSTIITCAIGAGTFFAQARIWPTLFKNYLEAVNLQFKYNGDFGCSPAGLLSSLLFRFHLPFSLAGIVCYVAYAIPIFFILLSLSRRFTAGLFSIQQWVPVLVVGTVLLNPRLIEYDVAPLTLLLTLIAWRSLKDAAAGTWFKRSFLLLLLVMNGLGLYDWTARKVLDGALLVALFGAGAWRLATLANKNAALQAEADYYLMEQQRIAVF